MNKGIAFLLLAATLSSCSKENHKEGTLSFRLTEQRTEVTVNNTTKASLSNEELDAFTITVPGSDISGVPYGTVKGTDYILKTGNYTAFAENCNAETGETTANNFGCIRYAGSQSFDISPSEKAAVTIACSVVNSKISVLLHKDFLSIFDASVTSVTISKNTEGTDRPLTFGNFSILSDSGTSAVAMTDASKNATQYAFYPAGSNLYIRITTRKTGGTETVTYQLTAPVTTQTATWHKISVSADLNSTSGGINVTVGSNTPEPINNGFSIDGYQNGDVTED